MYHVLIGPVMFGRPTGFKGVKTIIVCKPRTDQKYSSTYMRLYLGFSGHQKAERKALW